MPAATSALLDRLKLSLVCCWFAVGLSVLALASCSEDDRTTTPTPETTAVVRTALRPRAAPLEPRTSVTRPEIQTPTATTPAPFQAAASALAPAPLPSSQVQPTVSQSTGAAEQAAEPQLTAEPPPTVTGRAASSGSATDAPPPASTAAPEPLVFTSVSPGYDHTCALLDDGAAYCWGPNNDDGHLDVPAEVRFRQIAAGFRFTCGIRLDRGITCWGNSDHKKLAAPEGRFTDLDAGWDHACALGADGAVCWGWNANERATPPQDSAFVAIGAGAEHSCGLTINGDLRCWGKNGNGRADFQEGPLQALAVGTAHTCALRPDGTAFCQGENVQRQSDVPETLFAAISAGDDHTCGTRPDGTLECWGGASQIANIQLTSPQGVFTSVSAGFRRTCALTAQRHVACWEHPYVTIPTAPFDSLNLAKAVAHYALQQPVEAFPWPGGGLLIADLDGVIAIYGGNSEPRRILDITDKISTKGSEKGLLGVALDPDFGTFPYIYVYYTARSERDGVEPGARLSRFPVVAGQVVREDELVILEHPGLYDFHQGGSPRFGPDGMLYLGIGDGKCNECARYLSTLLGKIIRVDVRGATAAEPYRIPDDNPLRDDPDAKHEIWALGLRNPWRMSFDQKTGQLWVADVGAGFEEEVSIVTKGADMGWPLYEGFHCRRGSSETCDEVAETTPPMATYNHSHGCAVIGGVVYRGAALPQLNGAYLFGDLCSGRIWALMNGGTASGTVVEIADLDVPVVSFGVDAEGEVLVLAFGGHVWRLVEAETGYSAPSKIVPRITTPPVQGE